MKSTPRLHFVKPFRIMALALAGLTACSTSARARPQSDAAIALARAPVPFVENTGRPADPDARFITRTLIGPVKITDDGRLVYAMPRAGGAAGAAYTEITERLLDNFGCAGLAGSEPAAARFSCFRGADPERWQSNIPVFNAVQWRAAYPGIDYTLRAYGRTMEKIFTVLPGADPRAIRIALDGIDSLRTDAAGRLIARTIAGEFSFSTPIAFQAGALGFEPVSVRYEVCGHTYGFALGDYDPTRALIIDPLLGGTYLGGHGWDSAQDMALDGQGRVYVTGSGSTDFPYTLDAYDTNWHGVYVSLFDNDLTNLLASTFLGGSGSETAYAITLDAAGRVYITGNTSSTNFPTTPGAYQRTIAPVDSEDQNDDAFVAVFSADLSQLLACTLLGGHAPDTANAITLDAWTNVYIAGGTASSNFPTTAGAFQTELKGWGDGFIAKFNGSLSQLLAATLIGGTNYEEITCMQLAPAELIYTAGITSSTNFPVTGTPYQAVYGGGERDAFIAAFSSTLSTLHNATYIGGASNDWPNALAMAPDNAVYIAGDTYSANFPTTAGAFQTAFPANAPDEYQYHGFISRFDGGLHAILYSTFLGGSAGYDSVNDIQCDASGNIWAAGQTTASNFPTTAGAYSRVLKVPAGAPYAESDAFVVHISAALSSLFSSTFLGGHRSDYGHAIRRDQAGNVFVAGYTESYDFPTAPGAYERQYHVPYNFWHGDAFVAKLDATLGDLPAPPINVAATDQSYTDRIRLTWTASDQTDGYTIWRGLTANSADATLIGAIGDGETTDFIDRTIAPGTVYYYWVKATNASGASAFGYAAAGRRSAFCPIAADFDGDGRADPGLVHDGGWYAWMSGSGHARVGPLLAGAADRQFAAGDADGDRKADPCAIDAAGIWRAWFSASGYNPQLFPLGFAGGIAVMADFDGDGRADPTVYYGDTWYYWASSAQYAQRAQFTPNPGVTRTDQVPVAADFDGDGRADFAMFDPATGIWTAWLSGNWYQAYVPAIALAEPGALPVAGDFDGDGRADIAAYKVATGKWYAWLSTRNYIVYQPDIRLDW